MLARKLDEYVAHRRGSRASDPRGARHDRSFDPDLVATHLYRQYPPEVHALAERSVLAHLLKLEGEGVPRAKARRTGGPWTISEPRACVRPLRPAGQRVALVCAVHCSLARAQDTAGAGG